MKNREKGFAATAALLVALLVIMVGIGGYVAMNPEILGERPENENGTNIEEIDQSEVSAETTARISWRFTDAGEEDGIPYTDVTVTINDEPYTVGKFQGSCAEVGASGGVDGRGLLAGELAAAQCWFAGGGNEIGIFANEAGGIDIMVGVLDEGTAETASFRGDFEVRQTIDF